jgi:hypothetical protein
MLVATLAYDNSRQHVVERSFIPSVHRVEMIRASGTTVSRRSILPTGNLATMC